MYQLSSAGGERDYDFTEHTCSDKISTLPGLADKIWAINVGPWDSKSFSELKSSGKFKFIHDYLIEQGYGQQGTHLLIAISNDVKAVTVFPGDMRSEIEFRFHKAGICSRIPRRKE